jgi:MFS family permease
MPAGAPVDAQRPDTRTLARARVGVAVVFAVNGLLFASWLARTPAIRDALALSEIQLGLLLLCLSLGAVTALPLAGPVVQRFGPRAVVVAGALVAVLGQACLALGVAAGATPLAATGLAATGLGMGAWDVAMNVEGAAVEHRLGRSLMPRLHAAFSLGTVAGALVGLAASAARVPVPVQLIATVVIAAVLVGVAVRAFLPTEPATARTARPRPTGRSALTAWREPRTLLVGVMVLAFAFVEGSANDWLALTLVDAYGASEVVGALGLGVFVAAMTTMRLVGGAALDRWGRVAVLRVGALVAACGVTLVIVSPVVPLALVGALAWGAGVALGFPVGMSAGADDPARAAARVGVVSSIGYGAFLAGPPLIGFLAEASSLRHALGVVLVAAMVGLLTTGATRPLRTSGDLAG